MRVREVQWSRALSVVCEVAQGGRFIRFLRAVASDGELSVESEVPRVIGPRRTWPGYKFIV